jgi:hypothetical protein
MWLKSDDPSLNRAIWYWNPRQTGSKEEPDLAAEQQGIRLISAEVTASRNPIGIIDKRMTQTLQKLNKMPGKKRFYFVRSESMSKRAQSKVVNNNLDINVVLLED